MKTEIFFCWKIIEKKFADVKLGSLWIFSKNIEKINFFQGNLESIVRKFEIKKKSSFIIFFLEIGKIQGNSS